MNKNVLFLNPTAHIGGAEKSLLNIITELDKKTYTPIVVTPFYGDLTNICDQYKIKCICLPLSRTFFKASRQNIGSALMLPFLIFPLTLKLAHIAKKNNISIVHSNGIKMHLISVFLPLFYHCKIIWHVRDILKPGIFKTIFSLLSALIPHNIITNSHATTSSLISSAAFHFLSRSAVNKISTIYNSIDIEQFKKTLSLSQKKNMKKDLKLRNISFVILAIGHIAPLKGYHILIKAFIRFLNIYPHATLLIAGDNIYKTSDVYDTYFENIKKYSRKHTDKIIFLGQRSDIPQLLKIADLSVLASLSEGFGRTNIEALAAKTPVISTRVGGIPEILKHKKHAYLVNPSSIEELFKAFVWAVENPNKMRSFTEHGHHLVCNSFSKKKICEQISSLYNRI